MKKTLFSVSLITVLSLSTSLGWCSAPSLFSPKQSAETPCVVQNGHSFSHYLSMETYENLKAYHVGLRSIFPEYQIPSAQDLLTSIRSHCKFVGSLTQDGALNRFQFGKDRYFIFEEKDNKGHFYIASCKGLRHFTVNKRMVAAGIDNGHNFCYSGLNPFLQSTLSI